MKKIKKSLAETHPELAKQWHPTKNGNLTPKDVTCGNRKKVWWYLPYDDPETGKHFDFEWETRISHRSKGGGCPYLSSQAVWPGYNDLATKKPELVKEWHPVKNGNLKPEDVAPNSGVKVWWYLPYDDPKTGKHFDFEWETSICNRARGNGCPYLSGQAVWPGFNDLASRNPELAKQWHPTKNGDITPEKVSCGKDCKVWWLLSYDDPETGKHFDFEWMERIVNRLNGERCPFFSGKAVWPGYNDLATKAPELVKEWHPTKNGRLRPTDVTLHSGKEVWWFLPYDDPVTGKHFDFEWLAKINNRAHGRGCPYISGQAVWPGYNDLATISPKLTREWHPTKNRELTPSTTNCGTHDKVWWQLAYDDPETGKHFVFEWRGGVRERVNGVNCPYLSGQAVWPGYNDLATKSPELAKEWHPTRNGDLTPDDVTLYSSKKVWWYLPYDDPKTGKHFDFEWECTVDNRARGEGCPYLSGKAVYPGYNDLKTKNPELAKEWHPTRNGDLTPTDVLCGSDKKVWWYLLYDDPETGKHFDFEWRELISNRTNGYGCPYLTGHAVWPGYNDLASQSPELAKEWHPVKNRMVTAEQVYKNAVKKYWWLCSKCGYSWRAPVYLRICGEANCPNCRKNKKQHGIL